MAGEEEDKGPAAQLAKTQQELAEKDRSLAIERAARSEAERRGTQSAAEAQRYKKTLEDSASGQIDTAIKGLQTEADSLKRDYSAALAEGDFDKAADIQMKMSRNASLLLNAESTKVEITRKPNGEGSAGGFDKESFIGKQSARTAAWLRQHDEYFTDPKLQSKVTGAHHLAVGNGLTVDSDEYFSFIEQQAGMTEQRTERRPDPAPHQKVPQPGPRAPAAPPTREGSPLNRPANLRPGDRFIPAEMKAAADLCGNTPEQFYDEYVRLYNEGRIGDKYGIMGGRN